MYPLVIILAVAIVRKDKNVAYYVLPMTILGGTISLYHYLIQMTSLRDSLPINCSAYGPCTETRALVFGSVTLPHFVTIPLLALIAFIVISAMMVIVLKSKSKNVQRS